MNKVRDLRQEGKGPAEIYRSLQTDHFYKDFKFSKSTVERIVRNAPKPPTELREPSYWTLANSNGEDAKNILEAHKALIFSFGGKIGRPTIEQAEWVAKLLRTAPDFPMEIVWTFAGVYRLHVESDANTLPLDEYLAFAPWRSEEHYKLYTDAVRLGWLERPRPALWERFVEDQNLTLSE